nr:PAS domain S-box protein [Fimbriiglobus ruber]
MAAAVTLSTLLRSSLDPYLGDHHLFVLFLIPVLVTAWYGGWKPAVVAVVLGYLASDYLFIRPRWGLGFESIEHVVGTVFYVGVSVIGIVLSEQVRAARLRAESQADLLRVEITEHELTQEQLRRAKIRLEQRAEERVSELFHATIQIQGEGTARQEAEAKVLRLAAIVASSEDAIIGKDLTSLITDWNTGAEHLFGYTSAEVVGSPATLLALPDATDETVGIVEQLLRGEDVPPYETIRLRKDGREVPVSVRISPILVAGCVVGLSSINRDLTHSKQLAEQLRQAQKMETIGQLAGGVAHDFNNILTIMNGYAEILFEGTQPSDPSRDMLQQICDAGTRAAALTHQLLAFSRKQVLQPRVLNLNETVKSTEKLLRRLIGEDVRLATVMSPNIKPVKVDAGQMEQVILNLSINARDAMPHGGVLTIETSDVALGESYAQMHPEVWPGQYTLLTVSDTGTGMDATTKAHIFEPFFTTKGVGYGTGLSPISTAVN